MTIGGDIITAVDGISIKSYYDLVVYIEKFKSLANAYVFAKEKRAISAVSRKRGRFSTKPFPRCQVLS